MKKYYTKSEVRKNRKSLSVWSKRLFVVSFTCGYLFVCAKPGNGLPWTLLVFGLLCAVVGIVGLVFLDRTANPYRYDCN